MKKILLFISIVLLILTKSFAAEVDLTILKNSIDPAAKIKSVKPSVIQGLYEININNQIIYVSGDGEKVFSGDIYDLKHKISLTEKSKNNINKELLKEIAEKDKITYKAKKEKYNINIFTDITCGYCKKLHSHMTEYNKLGITINYLAFPRAGIGTKVARDMQKIWCAKNKTIALDKAKSKNKIPDNTCNKNQVEKQFLLGQDLGVNATPTIFFSDGSMHPGYRNPEELLKMLEENSKI